ncbi:hypothetical protein RI054_11g58300 [Pseudoscourfieldia marina]
MTRLEEKHESANAEPVYAHTRYVETKGSAPHATRVSTKQRANLRMHDCKFPALEGTTPHERCAKPQTIAQRVSARSYRRRSTSKRRWRSLRIARVLWRLCAAPWKRSARVRTNSHVANDAGARRDSDISGCRDARSRNASESLQAENDADTATPNSPTANRREKGTHQRTVRLSKRLEEVRQPCGFCYTLA